MSISPLSYIIERKLTRKSFTGLSFATIAALVFSPILAQAQARVITTPQVIPELPIEIETEVGPAGSLKKVPLWKETVELLEDPTAMVCGEEAGPGEPDIHCIATTERRPHFASYVPGVGTTGEEDEDGMPPLNTFDPCHNVLTGQPLRYRPDGEIDWSQPGALFDPNEVVATEAAMEYPSGDPGNPYFLISNIPTEVRTVIGELVACPQPISGPDANLRTRSHARYVCGTGSRRSSNWNLPEFDGRLIVNNPTRGSHRNIFGFSSSVSTDIPPHQTIVAEPACSADGTLLDEDGAPLVNEAGEPELEQPVNELHFINDEDPLDEFQGRLAAEVLGKALFWDMQVGSDGVQSCGSCHFHAGVDNRTRGQLNPNSLGGDLALDVRGHGSTTQDTNAIDIVAADFPFHRRGGDAPGDGAALLGTANDSNDVMSSMGVSRFRQFTDVLVGPDAFRTNDTSGVPTLRPDISADDVDPIPAMQGNRRVEPRNTPTMHAAAFNFDNFWDGRARHDFNGGSVFGPSDPFFHVFVNCTEDDPDGELQGLAAPLEAEEGPLCEWNEEYLGSTEGEGPVPVRIRFSSLASQAVGPPLSDFEMAFAGRNWQKIGKRMLQEGVVPLANQLVDPDDSRLGPWSNQGGSECSDTDVGKPGLCISYPDLIQAAFREDLWGNTSMHLQGTGVPMDNDCDPGDEIHEAGLSPEQLLGQAAQPATCDPFDGYVVHVAGGEAAAANTDQFTQMEANFSLFFGLAVQAYEQLLIPDDTPWDQFNDLYTRLGMGVAQPGEQGTLPPDVIRDLVLPEGGTLDVTSVPGMDEDVLFGFDMFAGGNLTAALPVGSARNPDGHGSNPFLRTARCMLCHLGPEQSDHTNNVNAGLLQSGTEVEYPTPPSSPEPTGVLRLVTGISLAEELEENAQDGVEVENRNFILGEFAGSVAPGFSTIELEAQSGVPIHSSSNNSIVAPALGTAFQDNGIYNVGLRPTHEDILRGGDDAFGFPLALAALAMKNLGGEDFEPCDGTEGTPGDSSSCTPGGIMPNFNPALGAGGGLFDTVGEGFPFAGTTHEQDSINPGLELEPADPLLPEYLAEWANNLPAGELGPYIDELAFAPNTVTHTPVAEYTEILFGADFHCGVYDPATFGSGPPNFGWGPQDSTGSSITRVKCPNNQTGAPANLGIDIVGGYIPGSLVAPPNGTWPWPNRVARNGASKVPQLRNVELTGPYFHTGSYLTLRSVVDFYFRGGDFPVTNVTDRDPNLVDVVTQAFGLGRTTGLDPNLLDGIPDATSQYEEYPDSGHGFTPEPEFVSREVAIEDAKTAIVKFLLALTDERVAHRSAPFDQPEIFVPIDGRAPTIDGGRPHLVGLASDQCQGFDFDTDSLDGNVLIGVQEANCFIQVPATGRTGQPERLTPFLIDTADHFLP